MLCVFAFGEQLESGNLQESVGSGPPPLPPCHRTGLIKS